MSRSLSKTERTSISRHGERASYDRDVANSILDEALIAHVGVDTGSGVMVLPMTYARINDELFLHGAVASRWLSSFRTGREVCVCVTLLDGLVLARSAFAHSMNFRSVVAYGTAVLVTDVDEKRRAFDALLDHMLPGRRDDTRAPDSKEIAATTVLKLPIDEASIKLRSGPPKDAKTDYALDHWAGVIPLALTAGSPIPDPAIEGDRVVPDYVSNFRRPS